MLYILVRETIIYRTGEKRAAYTFPRGEGGFCPYLEEQGQKTDEEYGKRRRKSLLGWNIIVSARIPHPPLRGTLSPGEGIALNNHLCDYSHCRGWRPRQPIVMKTDSYGASKAPPPTRFIHRTLSAFHTAGVILSKRSVSKDLFGIEYLIRRRFFDCAAYSSSAQNDTVYDRFYGIRLAR